MNPAPKAKRGSEYFLPNEDYKALTNVIETNNCYQRTYIQFVFISLLTLAGLSASLFTLSLSDNLLIQIINGIVFGFFSVQLGLIGHDLSHSGVFKSARLNKDLALLVWGLGCGLSEGRWFYKHNAHHASPNHLGHDPDLEIPFVFSHEQANEYSTFYKTWIFPYQPTLFWVGLWFVYPYNILNSLKFLFQDLSLRSLVEIFFMLVHFVLLFGFSIIFLPLSIAITFQLVVFLTMGVYMGLIFAPNHKGEDMLKAQAAYNWVHQITLTRNIKPGFFTSYFLGGLEHQIEHHLFPTMPRFRYQEARVLVRNFCQEQNIPYHETTWLTSLKQIHHSLETEAQAWRQS